MKLVFETDPLACVDIPYIYFSLSNGKLAAHKAKCAF